MISGLEAVDSENFRLVWEKPYSILMRAEMEIAISKDDVEVLRTAFHHTDEKQFNSVNLCAQKRKKVEPGLTVIEQIILDFKLWMASAS